MLNPNDFVPLFTLLTLETLDGVIDDLENPTGDDRQYIRGQRRIRALAIEQRDRRLATIEKMKTERQATK